VWDHVWPLLEDPDVVLATLERRIRREKERAIPEGERRTLMGVIEGAEAKRAKFQHAYAEGAMTLDDLKARSAEIDEQLRQARARLESVRDSGDRLAVLERLRENHLRHTAAARAAGRPPVLLQRVEASPKHRVRTYRYLGVRAVAEADGRVRISGRWFPEQFVGHTEDQLSSWSPSQKRVLWRGLLV
jgi:hypothetical protein